VEWLGVEYARLQPLDHMTDALTITS